MKPISESECRSLKLIEARRVYATRLVESIAESQKRLDELLLELKNNGRRYEKEETRVRRGRVQKL
jgi:hypothetical protein